MRRGHSVMSMFLAFVWAFLIVCSDDVLVYADFDCQESIALSSVILDGEDVWSESSTDFVLQDSGLLRIRLRSNNLHSRTRLFQLAMLTQGCSLQLTQCKKYIVPLEIEQYSNEKVIMNYLHRQDGDK